MNLTDEERIKYYKPDRDLYDVLVTRIKGIKKLAAVICNTQDEPLCLVQASNILDKTIEAFPYNMLFEHVVKAENIVIQDTDISPEKDSVIGKLDEVVMNEHYDVWADLESYHLRNLYMDIPCQLLAKFAAFGEKAGELFGVLISPNNARR